jgi:putative sigma-54 modulation protein
MHGTIDRKKLSVQSKQSLSRITGRGYIRIYTVNIPDRHDTHHPFHYPVPSLRAEFSLGACRQGAARPLCIFEASAYAICHSLPLNVLHPARPCQDPALYSQKPMNSVNSKPFPIHITPHHLSLSPALAEFVREKLAKVPRFASDVVAADIVLRRHHGTSHGKQFSASARLALAGRDIHATAVHADIYSAVVQLVARLARRSRKRKTRLNTRPRQRSVIPRLSGSIHGATPYPAASAGGSVSRNPQTNESRSRTRLTTRGGRSLSGRQTAGAIP